MYSRKMYSSSRDKTMQFTHSLKFSTAQALINNVLQKDKTEIF